MIQAISMDEYSNKYEYKRDTKYKSVKCKTARFHDIITDLVAQGLNIADIYRELVSLGYTSHITVLRVYCKRYFPQVAKYAGNQYTTSNRCKQGHEWTDFHTRFDIESGKSYRRCKICER